MRNMKEDDVLLLILWKIGSAYKYFDSSLGSPLLQVRTDLPNRHFPSEQLPPPFLEVHTIHFNRGRVNPQRTESQHASAQPQTSV